MVLLREDVERLERAGFEKKSFVAESGGFPRLRNVGGYCVFYDTVSRRCRVYDLRPLGCRLYPLVFDEALGARFDEECPLSEEFSRRCDEVEMACRLLAYLLDRLREEYGYTYNEELLAASFRELVFNCWTKATKNS